MNELELTEPAMVSSDYQAKQSKFLFPIVYLGSITLAELLTALWIPQVGLVLHGILLVTLITHASLVRKETQFRFLLALTLAPLIRMMSLSLPLLQFQFSDWYMIIGIPLLLAVLIAIRLSGYKSDQIGLSIGRQFPLQLGVAILGIGLGYIEYQILSPTPLANGLSLKQAWYPALILLLFTGFLEEIVFRGLMQRASLDYIGFAGVLYTAAVFAVLHIGYQSLLDIAFVFGVGLLFGLVVKRTNSLWGVTLSHGLTNITLFLVYPFIT